MHAGSHYTIKEFILWTRRDIYVLIIIATIPTVIYSVFNCTWLAIPWVPVAMVGTGAIFIVGFKNTQTYNRLWEARQIWGAIVNASRSWGIMTKDFVKADSTIHQQLIYRHCAWLTALRFQLRKPQVWENTNKPQYKEYRKRFRIPEWENKLEDELKKYLPVEEQDIFLVKRTGQLNSLHFNQNK
jgi:putative membrane protein